MHVIVVPIINRRTVAKAATIVALHSLAQNVGTRVPEHLPAWRKEGEGRGEEGREGEGRGVRGRRGEREGREERDRARGRKGEREGRGVEGRDGKGSGGKEGDRVRRREGRKRGW